MQRRAIDTGEGLGGIRPARHPAIHVRQGVGDVIGDDKTVTGELDGRFEDLRQREMAGAVFFQRQCKSRNRAGHADTERGVARFIGVGLAVRTQKDVARRRFRRGLAIIDGNVFVAFGGVDHHKTAAADISGARIGHGHRKAGRDRRIDRVAALSQDVGADLRRDFFLRDHHAVFGGNGMNGSKVRRRIGAALLCDDRSAENKRQRDRGNYLAPAG